MCIICDMLGRNRPHGISMCLDLTPESVVTVTDVIGCEYAHQLELVGALSAGDLQTYTALSDTAHTDSVPWLHTVIGQDISETKEILTLMEPLVMYLHILQYASMSGCHDEPFQSK